jgi:hypothetical protein
MSSFRRPETHRVAYQNRQAPLECANEYAPGQVCVHLQLAHRADGSCAFVGCRCLCFKSKKRNPSTAQKVDVGGTSFDSRFEGDHAKHLQLELEAGRIKSWRAHVPLELIVNGIIVATYKIDFEVTHLDDSIEYLETKGYQTADWRLKWKLFYALFSVIPGVKITLRQQGSWKPQFRRAG